MWKHYQEGNACKSADHRLQHIMEKERARNKEVGNEQLIQQLHQNPE
jgi:hypothetical protein